VVEQFIRMRWRLNDTMCETGADAGGDPVFSSLAATLLSSMKNSEAIEWAE
jgi:hypothetical protein